MDWRWFQLGLISRTTVVRIHLPLQSAYLICGWVKRKDGVQASIMLHVHNGSDTWFDSKSRDKCSFVKYRNG